MSISNNTLSTNKRCSEKNKFLSNLYQILNKDIEKYSYSSQTNRYLKILILSINFGSHTSTNEYITSSILNQQQYASHHNYDYKLQTERKHLYSPPYAEKVYFIFDELNKNIANNKYDYILWIDRDAIFMNHHISISQRLQEIDQIYPNILHYDMLVSTEFWAWINSGVILIKNTPFSRDLMERWIQTIEILDEWFNNTYLTIEIAHETKRFKDLFGNEWNCQDQGALNAILAGFDYKNEQHKWEFDKYNNIGAPHILHKGSDEWAILSQELLLDPKYKNKVKVVGEKWLNLNPGDVGKVGMHSITDAFILHFNGQKNKLEMLRELLKIINPKH